MIEPSQIMQLLENIVEQRELQGPYHGPRLPDGSCLYFSGPEQPCDLFGRLLDLLGFAAKDVAEGLEFEAAISSEVRELLSADSIELLSRLQYLHDDGMAWAEVVTRGKALLADPDFSNFPEPFDEAFNVELLPQA